MYNYIDEISKIAQGIIKSYEDNKKIAIDCTLGNGHDTDFLSKSFDRVYAFDIQKEACDKYSKNKNTIVINDSHEYLGKYINENVDCIMYNLGFLPGSKDKAITTKSESTIKSIDEGLKILNPRGIMTICVYIGHDEGKREETCIVDYLSKLPKDRFAVMEHRYINRNNLAPRLFVIERNSN